MADDLAEHAAHRQLQLGRHPVALVHLGGERLDLSAHLVEQLLLQPGRVGVKQVTQGVERAGIDHVLQRQARAELGGEQTGAHHRVAGERGEVGGGDDSADRVHRSVSWGLAGGRAGAAACVPAASAVSARWASS